MEFDTPTVRILNWGALVREAWGAEYNVPDVVYKFSNGREFKDSGEHHGIYDPQGS